MMRRLAIGLVQTGVSIAIPFVVVMVIVTTFGDRIEVELARGFGWPTIAFAILVLVALVAAGMLAAEWIGNRLRKSSQ